MRFTPPLSPLVYLTLACASSPLRSDPGSLLPRSPRPGSPDGFDYLHHALDARSKDQDTNLTLRFGLVSQDMPGLESAVHDVSTPGNPRYRKFLSKEEVSTGAFNDETIV
jgi:hypothetical protein